MASLTRRSTPIEPRWTRCDSGSITAPPWPVELPVDAFTILTPNSFHPSPQSAPQRGHRALRRVAPNRSRLQVHPKRTPRPAGRALTNLPICPHVGQLSPIEKCTSLAPPQCHRYGEYIPFDIFLYWPYSTIDMYPAACYAFYVIRELPPSGTSPALPSVQKETAGGESHWEAVPRPEEGCHDRDCKEC